MGNLHAARCNVARANAVVDAVLVAAVVAATVAGVAWVREAKRRYERAHAPARYHGETKCAREQPVAIPSEGLADSLTVCTLVVRRSGDTVFVENYAEPVVLVVRP